jgi:AcrR family transcriptional regulator
MSPKVSAEYMRERRAEILAAATKVFSEKGFHASTLSDIGEKAEVSKGFIYTHFKSKEAVIDGISEQWETIDDERFDVAEGMPKAIDGVADLTKSAIRRAHRPDFTDSIRLGLFVWAEVLINPAVQKSQQRLSERWERHFRDLVSRARDEADIGARHSVDSVVWFLGSLVAGIFLSKGVKGSMPDVEGLEKLVDSFLDSLK